MDYIDYREQLGIGLNDKAKQEQFMSKIQVFLQSYSNIEFNEKQESNFCYNIGTECLLENKDIFDLDFVNKEPYGLQRIWLYLKKKTSNFSDFLASIVILANTYSGTSKDKKTITNAIKIALKDSHIEFELIEDKDGVFIFPKGAKELDDALVSEPLEWLKDYPQAYKTYCIALKQYSDGIYIRDVADNLRKALEDFLREFLENSNDFNKNKKEVEKYLKSQNADSHLITILVALLNHYYLLNNEVAKHNDKMDKKYLEFLLYQTGIFIRTLIVVKKEENKQ